MNIYPINLQSVEAYNQKSMPENENRRNSVINDNIATNSNNTTSYVGEYYSNEKMKINYQNSDGDSFSFDYEKVEYQRNEASLENINNSSDDKKQIIDDINNLYNQMKKNVMEELLKSFGYQEKKVNNISESNKTENLKEIPGLPEYWNAENTSQRIFEFAISFASLSEQDVEGYYKMMRGAIQDGYNSAIGEIGDSVTEEVSSLSKNTLDLALEKLDKWASDQGIDVASVNEKT